ncbi:hypothetical protein [Nonomuraea sediminis]|uniref:hypothetical protein n=1 Tax=Nonomuraea sediminis TaxID=2835864 RepID=UPI001BDD4D72|nr:hypothetical protein [Nonomuraea sediminis]
MTTGKGPTPRDDLVTMLAVDVGKLGARVDNISDKVGDIERQVGELAPVAAVVSELRERTTAIADTLTRMNNRTTGGEPQKTWSWTGMGPEERAERLDELQSWVTEVLVPQYGDYLRDQTLKPCWARHPAAVNELAWLYVEWFNAYLAEERRTRDAADWHDRWLPGVITRLKTVFRGCPHDPGE